MNKLTYGIAIGAVALGAAGYLGINTFAQSNAAAEQQASVDAAPIINESNDIIVDAIVVPIREADLSLPTSGIVQAIYVEEGDSIEVGQTIIQLNSERLQASLAQAEANLANAEASLADLLAPPQEEEIAKYQSSVTSAQASLQDVLDGASIAEIAAKEADLANAAAEMRLAQSDYDEVKWRSDIAMLDEALELEKATNNYNAAKANLDDLLAEAATSDVASANAGIVSAQADLDLLLAGSTQEALDAAKATVAANQAAVRDAQAALNEATLVAPFSGIVAAVDTEVGEQVSSGMAIVQLADTSEWYIETEDLTELDVVSVERGDGVTVSFDALSDVALNGTIKNIKPLGENNQGDITYTVLVELSEQDERLRWNMSAEASIAPDEHGRAAGIDQSVELTVDATQISGQSAAASESKTIGDLLAVTTTESIMADSVALSYTVGQVNVDGSVLNVRQEPTTNSPVIGTLDDGGSINVLSRNADATWLELEFDNGESGWVSAEYVLLDAPNTNLAINTNVSGL